MVKAAIHYQDDLEHEGLLSFDVKYDSAPEAKNVKKQITLRQKKLRQVKREINSTQKQIRAEYAQEMSSAGSGGSLALSLFGKRGLAGQWRAGAKADLRTQRDDDLEPYNDLKRAIDEMILQLDSAKIQADDYIQKE